ncbi:protein BZR1 homolog 3-like [Andrographis paniculata]|uniref:protein BZR1 homolog 3-like n=1 Tax=Andrographis paniculata TaxID=175694 RepID=UPI0021E76296|nr:protein BZR1 homolog 3-like [Andrographis paniculata]
MKEAVRERGGGNGGNGRSAVEKERTKMRERQRRSITTNIFHGLRKHGGYRLSPRADINEVLRHLASEAGWIIEPDGTTYRSSAAADGRNHACPLCGGGRKSTGPPTPTGSYFAGGGGGDCSTTASPHRSDSAANNHPSVSGVPSLSPSGVMATNDALLAIYMCGAVQQNPRGGGGGVYGGGQQLYLVHQNSASNQNTPAGSP